ncbi:MAG: M20 family metallopeptidase [Propioniciclava sp.]|uniref:M20 family metallopeptidase n=1 Tax=Propioniciclava sp. TaxID=2038686 RepID=UPI0039E3ECAC
MFDLTQITASEQGRRAAIAGSLAADADALLALNRAIHGYAEISFQEHRSAQEITDYLAARGFTVEHGAGGLETAFVATAGSGEFTVGFCIEYDALPEIGHGCGHNVITGASVGAAVALASVADELGITVQAIGTPAEEHGGGKQLMLDAGVFDGVDMALMTHAGPEIPTMNVIGADSNSVVRVRATFTGRGAHAAAAPDRGINALDAVVVSQVAVGLLRQQIPSTNRVAVIVREGGYETNIIPERAVADFEVRATTLAEHHALFARVKACFEAGALATGCTVEFADIEPLYEPLTQNEVIGRHWNEAMGSFGYDVALNPPRLAGSTDMGNVSNRIPSIHPLAGITGVTCALHTADFAAAAITDAADQVMFQSALAMAWAAEAVASNDEERTQIRADKEALRMALAQASAD